MRAHVLTVAVTILIVSLNSAPTRAEDPPEVVLNVGDPAPMFVGVDHDGNQWSLKEHVGKNYLVIYFYPADFTTGCRKQAVAWRENLNSLADEDIEVVGISGDSVETHQLFRKTWNLNFTLIADPNVTIPPLFGVPDRRGGRAFARGPDGKPLLDDQGNQLKLKRNATFLRWTFVIDPNGKIVYLNRKVRPARDSEQVLEFIRASGRID